MEGVFVDTEKLGTIQREPFTGFSYSELRINAGDGGWGDLFEAAHHGAGDAFVVKSVNVLSEGLGGMPSWENTRELREERNLAVAAAESAAANAQASGVAKALHMANPAHIESFALDAGTTAAGAV